MSTLLSLAQIITTLETYYPLALAQPWDKVGLVVGNADQQIQRILCCVDVTDRTVAYALAHGCDLIIAHHPLLLRGICTLTETSFAGRVITQLIQANIALYTTHTNADSAVGGVADVLADKLGIIQRQPLEPKDIRPALDQWYVYVPPADMPSVQHAIVASGGAAGGNYDHCMWQSLGAGQFRPLEQANPTVGHIGQVHTEPEVKLEFLAPHSLQKQIATAIVQAHPYEAPALGYFPCSNPFPVETGIGRIGTLVQPRTLADFTTHLRKILPTTLGGIRISGTLDSQIATVAVCPGAGDGFLDTVREKNIDVYVTADLRHHPVDEYHKGGGKAVIDAGHWATEFPWCIDVAQRLQKEYAQLNVIAFPEPTEPWTAIV